MALDVNDFASGRLITELPIATTTGVTVQMTRINGSYVAMPTGEFYLYLMRQTETDRFVEKLKVAAGTSNNSTTGVTTLGTLTRNISLTDGTDTTGTSATRTWPSGTLIYIGVGSEILERVPFTNEVNTFTKGQIISGSTSYLQVPSLTTAQRTALSGANGMIVYDSDLSQFYKYEAGAWAAVATGTFSNAADGTAGKVDIANGTEIGAGTATDATSGAINVIPVSQTVKTSSGAGDENKLPVLGSSGTLALGFIPAIGVTLGGTGRTTLTTGALLLGAGTSQVGLVGPGSNNQVPMSNGTTIAMADPKSYRKPVLSSAASSTTLTNPTSSTAYDTHTYTIPANDLVAGVWYEGEALTTITYGTSGVFTLGLYLGGSILASPSFASNSGSSGKIITSFKIKGTAAAGGSVAVRGSIINTISSSSKETVLDYNELNFATNGSLAITLKGHFGTSNGGNSTAIASSEIWKCSTTLF